MATGGRLDVGDKRRSVSEKDEKKCNEEREAACGSCVKAVKNGDRAVQCDKCTLWFHTACVKMSADVYKAIMNFNAESGCLLQWFCRECSAVVSNLGKQDKDGEIESRLRKVEVDVELVKCAMEGISKGDSEKDLRPRRTWFESQEDRSQELPDNSKRELQVQVNEALQREKKRKNLVIMGLPEEKNDDGLQQKVQEIADKLVEEVDRKIKVNIIGRIGRAVKDKVRPVRISIEDTLDRTRILSRATRLKGQR
jgi:hypothetical protein